MRREQIGLLVLLAAVIGSALGVVYAKYENRKLFVELQALQNERDKMDVDWGRLQLEQSTWATHGRIETLARNKLGMHIPQPDEIVIIHP